jgi:hypothetical protein
MLTVYFGSSGKDNNEPQLPTPFQLFSFFSSRDNKFQKITNGNQLLCTPFFVPLKITTQLNQLLCTPLFVPVKDNYRTYPSSYNSFSCHIKGNYMPRSFPQPCHPPNFCPEAPIHLRQGLGRKDGVEEGPKGGGAGGNLRGPLHMPSDMGLVSLVGALCQVLCQVQEL